MHSLSQIGRASFDLFRLGLKVVLLCAVAVLLVYHYSVPALHQPSNAVDPYKDMRPLAPFVQNCSLIAGLLLLVAAIIELFRHQRKRAMVDFIFMVIALFVWKLAGFWEVGIISD